MEKRLTKLTAANCDEVVYKRGAKRRRERNTGPESVGRGPAPLKLTPSKRALVERLEKTAKILVVTAETISFTPNAKQPLPGLPLGYYFKGGAAREILRRTIMPDTPPMHVRDYDLVRFLGSSDGQDHELAMRFMKSDYEYGHGVEVVESKSTYFKTRDLTVNEVLCRNTTVEASYTALQHMFSRVLTPTPYILSAPAGMRSRTFMKALRLAAEGLLLNIPFETDFPEDLEPAPFDIALHLNRAFAAGTAVAEEYVLSAWKTGALLPELAAPPSLADAIEFLAGRLARGIGFFNRIPPELLQEMRV